MAAPICSGRCSLDGSIHVSHARLTQNFMALLCSPMYVELPVSILTV